MFKQAYSRAVAHALVQGGHAAFPADTLDKVADHVAERIDFNPTSGAVPRETTAKIATALIEASAWLKDQGRQPAPFAKVASVEDLGRLAHQHALSLMEKAAEGSNIEGADKGNKERSSAEGKMDEKARPENYAANSRGSTAVDTKPGAVGKEQEQPNKPSESPAGSNSVTEQSKGASLAELIAKVAEGSNLEPGRTGNKERSSAEGKMDDKARPEGYALLPSQGDLGELMQMYSSQSAVGKEQAHPSGPSNTPGGSNSLTETSGKSASAVEDPYLALFKKTATEVAPHLPGALTEEVKIAHVRACMGMTNEEKAQYLVGLQKEAADKTTPAVPPGSRGDSYGKHNSDATHSRPGAYDGRGANQGTKQAEMPAFIQEKIDAKKDGEGEKKDGDKKDEEKKDDEKKASLADHFRRISAVVAPARQ